VKQDDVLTTGAMLLGSGVAGYALGRFVIERWLAGPGADVPPAQAIAAVAAPALQAPSPPPVSNPPPAAEPSIRPPAQARPTPAPSRPRRPAPSIAHEPDAGPVSTPAQLDATARPSGEERPVTSPAQVADAAPPGSGGSAAKRDEDDRATSRRPSRRFDRIFDMYRESIPIEFLRALARRESDLNPEERTGPAWGLMQVVEVVRKDFNQAHGTRYTRQDLLDPAINVAIACWLLRFIIAQYAKHQDGVPNLRADWNNPRFVALVVAGWNAGFSASGGVLKVVRHLKARGITDITIDLVFQHARAAGAVRHLSNAAKLRWCKSVVRLYEHDRAAARGERPSPS
jgi:hypothetical protein